MSYSPPTPPEELPTAVVETLEECSTDQLRHAARYASEFAEYRDREARLDERDDEDGESIESEELPDDVPPKATVTITEINENRYYYWQWRDGDRIRSKYEAPVDPDE